MIKTKEHVRYSELDIVLKLAAIITALIYTEYDKELIITSTKTDSKHMRGSLHYIGLAFDARIRDFEGKTQIRAAHQQIQRELATLDYRFQVILESDHIHIEYDRRHKNAQTQD